MTLSPGDLRRELDRAVQEVAEWPEWLRVSAGLPPKSRGIMTKEQILERIAQELDNPDALEHMTLMDVDTVERDLGRTTADGTLVSTKVIIRIQIQHRARLQHGH